jgi:hypothetical protein
MIGASTGFVARSPSTGVRWPYERGAAVMLVPIVTHDRASLMLTGRF